MAVTKWYRNDGFSTDGFFLIKTENENAYLKRQLIEEGTQPNIKLLVDRTTSGMFTKLKKLREFNDPSILVGITIVEFESADKDFKTIINKKLLQYFPKESKLTFESSGEFNPVIVRRNDEFIGLIMPLHYAR